MSTARPYRKIRVPSNAMRPTLSLGQRVMVDVGAYSNSVPALGDVIFFHSPLDTTPVKPDPSTPAAACADPQPRPGSGKYIKRIVAGEGDVISISRGFVVRNGMTERAGQIKAGDRRLDQDFPAPIVIPPGTWYVLGDNRAQSIDSRWWGPIPGAWIIGRVELAPAHG